MPSRPKATAEFIGPPADKADHVLTAASCGPPDARMRSMRVSPHTTKRVIEDKLVEAGPDHFVASGTSLPISLRSSSHKLGGIAHLLILSSKRASE